MRVVFGMPKPRDGVSYQALKPLNLLLQERHFSLTSPLANKRMGWTLFPEEVMLPVLPGKVPFSFKFTFPSLDVEDTRFGFRRRESLRKFERRSIPEVQDAEPIDIRKSLLARIAVQLCPTPKSISLLGRQRPSSDEPALLTCRGQHVTDRILDYTIKKFVAISVLGSLTLPIPKASFSLGPRAKQLSGGNPLFEVYQFALHPADSRLA